MSDAAAAALVAEPIVPIEPAASAEATPSEAPATEVPAPSPEAVESDGGSASEPVIPDAGLLTATDPAKEAASAEEPKPGGETPPVEGETAEPVVPVVEPREIEPVSYEAFTIPEGVTLQEEGLNKFTGLVSPLGVPQEAAQQLLDLGIAEIQRVHDFERTEQHRVWNETRAGWRTQIMSDPELGGGGKDQFEANRAAAVRAMDLFVPEQNREAFNQALMLTGMTDHPEFFRFLVNVARTFDEASPSPTPHRPPPDIGRNPGGGRRLNYDAPTSRPNGAA